MTNPVSIPGDLIVSGSIRLNGSLTPAVTKANILAVSELQPFAVPLTSLRVWDAMQTALPGTPATDDLALIGGTFATDTPSVRSEDLKALGATNKRARFLVQVPWEFVAGQRLRLRFKAGMITTVATPSATLDCEAYRVQDDPDNAIGSDLVTTAATTMNSLVFSDIDFTINTAALVPGDILDVRITAAVNDAATGTAVIAGITSIRLMADVR